jgi:uncharacterized protein (TIGR02145 family)
MKIYDNLKKMRNSILLKSLFLMALWLVCLGQMTAQNVAKIGTTEYATLQDAVDAAYEMTGDITIDLVDNTSESVTITQKANLNLTLNGNEHILTGRIIVDGATRLGTETVLIQNFNFVYNTGYTDNPRGLVCIAPSSNTNAHNITVSNCSFDGGGDEWAKSNVSGFRAGSSNTHFNTVLENCTATQLHSLVQCAAGTNLTVIGCTATEVKNGINISGGSGNFIITDNTITTLTGGDQYAFRMKDGATTSKEATLSGNNFTAPRAIEMNNSSTASTLNITSGNYYGEIYKESADVATFSFTGGTFSEPKATVDGYCAYGYAAVANDPDAEHCTVRKLEIARIGTTTYPSLQDALDTAYTMTGDVTIELLKNTEEDVTIRQKAGLNYIIEGNNDTLNGRIFVDGGRIFPNSVGEVTITNLNFTYNDALTYKSNGDDRGFICNSQNNLSYAAHVTVSNCTFDGGDPANGMAAYRDPSSAQSWDITLDHLVAKNCHSLVQATSVSGMAITNCNATDNVKNGINISGGGSDHIPGVTNIYTIANDTLTCNTDGEYSIRIQEHGRGTDTFKLADNMFTAPKAIISKHNTACVIAASSGLYDGDISLENSDAATFSFTGGTFSEPKTTVDGYCAYGYEAVANDPDEEHCTVRKLEVAQIGTTTYPYLQDALDSAHTMTGNVTIELLKDITGYSIVHQKAGLNLTIEGNNDTIFGQIIVDGDGRAAGTETLTIQNLNFKGDKTNFCAGTDAFVLVPSTKDANKPYTTGKYNYAHNITIDQCSFTSTSSALEVVGIKATSGATCYNLVVSNTTGDNLHSLAQLTATEGATIDHCSATATGSFVNISGGSAADTISNCTFTGVDPNDGYAVRENSNSSVEITLINNTFEAKNVLQLGKNGGSNASGHINVESGTYKGVLFNDQSATGTATFVFTGGTFTEDSATVAQWCAEGYFAVPNDPSEDLCTVYRMYALIYDRNGGNGTMDTIRVKKDVPEADRTLVVANCEFTPFDAFHTFAIWNTVSDSTGISFNPGDPIVMNSDTVLYAIWKEGATIYYDANGGTGTIPYQSKDFGVDITLSDGAAFSRTDSTLYRWNTAADESGDNYDLGGTYSADVNVTMYAVWRLNLDMTTSATDVVCYGENNGTDTVKIIGGEAPYQIVLSGGALTDNVEVTTDQNPYIFTDLKPSLNAYKVRLTDVLTKDTITGTFTISQPDTLVISSITVPDAPCPLMGEGEYAVSMTTTGGNGGNVIAWGGDAVDVNDLSTIVTSEADDRDRTYTVTVTVTDNKGCVATGSADFSVAPVIANDETTHSNTTMTIAAINKDIMYGCDTIIRDFGTPSFAFTNAAITEAILDTVYNNVSTIAPDSVFPVGTTTITWTAVDTCGHIVTAEQEVVIGYLPCPTAIDGNGNEYSTVRVGCYCWMAENLRATVYSDGSNRPIPNVMHYTAPTRAIDPNGNLYDWNATMDVPNNSIADIEAAYAAGESLQGICPQGWHVPTEAELANLMSSASTEDLMAVNIWLPDNGTNTTGFNMLPSGYYNSELDRYERKFVSAYFWIFTPPTAVYHACEFGAACSTMELIPGSLNAGFSVRCVIDE